jgi:hypothetical protein
MENSMSNEGKCSIEKRENSRVELDPAVQSCPRYMKMQIAARRLSTKLKRPQYHLADQKIVTLNKLFALFLSSILMGLPISTMAQEQNFPLPSTTGILGNKDAGALAEINAYLVAVSTTGWQNLQGTGTLTFPNGDMHPASLYLRESKYSRLDITMDSGTRSLRVSGFVGRFRDEKGNAGVLTPASSGAGIVAFPRIWTNAAVSAKVSLYDQKTYVEAGQSLHRVTIEYPLDDQDGSSFSKRTAATDLYFDPNSHLLLFSVDSFSVSTMRQRLVRVTSYADYQPFEGVSVPATISQFLNGQDQWTLQLSHVTINTSLPISTFLF